MNMKMEYAFIAGVELDKEITCSRCILYFDCDFDLDDCPWLKMIGDIEED